jgi:hypothetical protein
LNLEPHSLTVRGLTLTSFDAVHAPRTLRAVPIERGFPIVEVHEFKGPLGAQRLDVVQPFSVALGAGFLEIDLGRLIDAKRAIHGGPVAFFVDGAVFVGLRIQELTSDQMSILRSHQPLPHPNLGVDQDS